MSCHRLQVIHKQLKQVNLQQTMAGSPVTTHVLDTALGKPAKRVPISLFIQQEEDKNWKQIATGETNNDGRCPGLITQDQFVVGTYKITFDTEVYFKMNGQEGFYPYVDIVFTIKNPHDHYHVPLLLSPFGYSTYRGS